MSKPLQGKFRPKHPEKYLGNVANIVFRSSWERMFLEFCDTNPNVLRYGSEEVVVPYKNPFDNRFHRYFVDFYVELRKKDGSIGKKLIEIKPFAQTKKPAQPKKITRGYKNALVTYMINEAKWDAAKEYATERGIEFQVLTEYQLGLKKVQNG